MSQQNECRRCDGVGRVHPRKRNGRVDWGTLVYCVCRGDRAGKVASPALELEDEPERAVCIPEGADYNQLYDFPMSWDWHRFYSVRDRGYDPGPDEPAEPMWTVEAQETGTRERPSISRGELRQIKAELLYVRNKLVELQMSRAQKKGKVSRPTGVIPL